MRGIRQLPPIYVELLHEVERAHVLKILRRYDGNKTLAASALGISRSRLYRKLKEYGALDSAIPVEVAGDPS